MIYQSKQNFISKNSSYENNFDNMQTLDVICRKRYFPLDNQGKKDDQYKWVKNQYIFFLKKPVTY